MHASVWASEKSGYDICFRGHRYAIFIFNDDRQLAYLNSELCLIYRLLSIDKFLRSSQLAAHSGLFVSVNDGLVNFLHVRLWLHPALRSIDV